MSCRDVTSLNINIRSLGTLILWPYVISEIKHIILQWVKTTSFIVLLCSCLCRIEVNILMLSFTYVVLTHILKGYKKNYVNKYFDRSFKR